MTLAHRPAPRPPGPEAQATFGLVLLAVATVGYGFAAVAYDAGTPQRIGLALMLAGFLVAGATQAVAERGVAPGLPAGLAAASAGALLWLGEGVVEGSLGGLAGALYAGGLLVAAVDAGRTVGPTPAACAPLRRGLALTAAGALLWIPSDFLAQASLWQPGNLLAALGALLAAGVFRTTPSYDDTPPERPGGVKAGPGA